MTLFIFSNFTFFDIHQLDLGLQSYKVAPSVNVKCFSGCEFVWAGLPDRLMQ